MAGDATEAAQHSERGITDEGPADSPRQLQLVATKHHGMLYLDRVDAGQVVCTNVWTHERVRLPPGDWEIVHDADSGMYAFVGGQSGEDVLDPDAFPWTKVVFERADTGDLYVHCPGRGKYRGPQSMEELATRFSTAAVTLEIPPTNAKIEMDCYVFHRPRDLQSRCFWSMASVYTACNLTTYNKTPSKWVWTGQLAWHTNLCHAFGPQQCIVQSTHTPDGCDKEQKDSFASRCLPSTSVSTCGFLWLLLRWGTLKPRRGGFQDPSNRQSALSILRSLMDSAGALGPWQLLLHCNPSWQCHWPRPPAVLPGFVIVTMEVSAEGFVDVSPFAERSRAEPPLSAVSLWWSEIERAIEARDLKQIPLCLFVEVAFAKHLTTGPMSAQVVLQAASRLEYVMGQSKQMLGKQYGRLSAKVDDFEDDMPTRCIVDRRLLQYVLAGQFLAKGNHEFHMMTDKAWIGGMPLQVTVQTLPSGHAILCCPAVPRHRTIRTQGEFQILLTENFGGYPKQRFWWIRQTRRIAATTTGGTKRKYPYLPNGHQNLSL